jgi:hypothetical protein
VITFLPWLFTCKEKDTGRILEEAKNQSGKGSEEKNLSLPETESHSFSPQPVNLLTNLS